METFGNTILRAFSPGTLGALAALLLLALLVAGVVVVASFTTDRRTVAMGRELSVLVGSLAIFGAVAGYAGGLSRAAAVGDIIPAVVGLAGGVAVYLFGVDRSKGTVASVALAAFTIALFLGYAFGSDVRGDNDRNMAIRDACLGLFYDPDTFATADRLTLTMGEDYQRYRECLGYLG